MIKLFIMYIYMLVVYTEHVHAFEFPHESYLHKLKKLVRKPDFHTISQTSDKVSELVQKCTVLPHRDD